MHPLVGGVQLCMRCITLPYAELTGLYLTQKAIEEQTSLDQFDSKTVLKLIQYSAQVTADMCRGQAMDLDSRGKHIDIRTIKYDVLL